MHTPCRNVKPLIAVWMTANPAAAPLAATPMTIRAAPRAAVPAMVAAKAVTSPELASIHLMTASVVAVILSMKGFSVPSSAFR